jgi:hypothetical protein
MGPPLFGFFHCEVFEETQHVLMRQILEFPGVEEQAAAHGAMLEQAVRLFEVHHANHPGAGARPVDAVHFVEVAPALICQVASVS